jgi:P-type Ca2+ transporter type 2C
MGSRGTDVAREAASLVLLNDDFASLVGAVRLGRRIYRNIQHAMSYLVAVHIPIAGMGLLPVLFGWPLLLYPVHVLFLEFIVDPACSLVFEADRADGRVMQRPPRAPAARLFSAAIVRHSVLMGTVALLYAIAVYGVALMLLAEREARTLAFMAMVLGNLLLILVSRAQGESLQHTLARPNAVFWWIIVVTLAALTVVIAVPQAADLFGFAMPPLRASVIVMLAALGLMLPAVLRGRRRGVQ